MDAVKILAYEVHDDTRGDGATIAEGTADPRNSPREVLDEIQREETTGILGPSISEVTTDS